MRKSWLATLGENYCIVGPGASGKSTLYDRQMNRVGKFRFVDDAFLHGTSGMVAYKTPNTSIAEYINRIADTNIVTVVCWCERKELERRLNERLKRRMKKTKDSARKRELLKIHKKNMEFDYNNLAVALYGKKSIWVNMSGKK